MSITAKSSSILKRDSFLYVMRLVTGIVIARNLGPEMLGIYVVLTMIPTFAESFGRFKFDVAAVYFLGKKQYTSGEMIHTLNVLALAASSLIVIFVLWQFEWIYNLLFGRDKYDASLLVHFILLQIPLHFLFMNYSYLIIQKEDVLTYNRMIIIQALVSSVFPVALLLLTDLGLWGIVGSTVLGTLLGLLYGIANFEATGKTGNLLNLKLIRDLFGYSTKLYAGGLVGHLQAYVSNLLVALYLPAAQVAFFSVGKGIGQIVERVPAALNTILLARLANSDDQISAATLTAKAFRLMLTLLAVVGLLAILLIYPTVLFGYGEDYLPAISPFLILIPSIILAGASSPIMAYFYSLNRADLGITLNVPSLIIQISLAFVFIPLWGLEGAALSFAAGLTTFSLINIWMFCRLSSCTLRDHLMVRAEDICYLLNLASQEANKILTLVKPKRV